MLNDSSSFYWYGIIYRKLLEKEEFSNLVDNCFKEYLPYFESIYVDGGIIDKLIEKYNTMFELNYEEYLNGGANWIVSKPYSSYSKVPLETYNDNVEYLKTWLEKRKKFIEDSLN